MIIDGKKIAEDVVAKLNIERPLLPKDVRLGIVLTDGDMATASFVRIKERVAERLGIVVVRETLSPDATTEEAIACVERLAKMTDGVVVQLPLPKSVDTEAVLAAIPLSQDPDVINPDPRVRMVRPPIAEAISEIFLQSDVAAKQKKAVVVGMGRLVGAPAFELLSDLGAEVSAVTLEQGSLEELQDADIVILGAGKPALVTPDLLKPGVVLIDAGTSEASGKLVGDADPRCAEVAAVFTPVPGGVGPIAVAMLFRNLYALVKSRG